MEDERVFSSSVLESFQTNKQPVAICSGNLMLRRGGWARRLDAPEARRLDAQARRLDAQILSSIFLSFLFLENKVTRFNVLPRSLPSMKELDTCCCSSLFSCFGTESFVFWKFRVLEQQQQVVFWSFPLLLRLQRQYLLIIVTNSTEVVRDKPNKARFVLVFRVLLTNKQTNSSSFFFSSKKTKIKDEEAFNEN